MFEGPDEAIARIEDDIRRAQERGVRLPQLQEAIDAVRVRSTSRQRDIAVEVDSSGALKRVEITDAALDRGGRAISQELLSLVAEATQEARAQSLALTVEIMGEDDPIVKVVAADLEAEATGDRSWRFGGAS